MKLNGLDLFSGIGGISLALDPWVTPVAYCESDAYAQSVLLSRMSDGTLPRAPIWDDVQTLTREMLPAIDIIFGGFPCQDISSAGSGAGLAGKRSGLFFEVIRLTKECQPTFVFLENAPAIRTRGLGQVLREFAGIGYDCRWLVNTAKEVGAPHRRRRWFLLAKRADPNGWRFESIRQQESQGLKGQSGCESNGLGKVWHLDTATHARWWTVEPQVGRMVNGIERGLDASIWRNRIKCLGNSVVPPQAQAAFKELLGLSA